MAWLRKLPMYAVVLLISAVLIGAAGLGYYAFATFGSTRVTGQQNSGGKGEPYEWNGQRLLMQSAVNARGSTCVIRGSDGAQRSVWVPFSTSKGMFNSPDFAELAPQPGTKATIICSHTVDIFAGDTAVARARTVHSYLYKVGIPALITILVLLALGIPMLRARGEKGVS